MDSFANRPSREGAENHSKRIVQKDTIQRQIETKRNNFRKDGAPPRRQTNSRNNNNLSKEAESTRILVDAYVKHFG